MTFTQLVNTAFPLTKRKAASIQQATSPRERIGSTILTDTWIHYVSLGIILVTGLLMRVVYINALGYNSDEAVYAGQGAAIARLPHLTELFPVFRAHPMLFQFIVGMAFKVAPYDWVGRLLSVGFGMATVILVYFLGRLLYGRQAGLYAALFMAVMPYHVIVSRQVLLDGPMTFCATLTLYLLARFGLSQKPIWLIAAGAGMGLTFLSKEIGILLLGSIYVFLALSPELKVRIHHLILSFMTMVFLMSPYPLATMLSGAKSKKSAGSYFIWQLFRRPNHTWDFYLMEVPPAIGVLIIIAALFGLWYLRHENSWREKLMVSWIIVPVVFFELWPTKGFQYLLPIAPAFVMLAVRTITVLPRKDISFEALHEHTTLREANPLWQIGSPSILKCRRIKATSNGRSANKSHSMTSSGEATPQEQAGGQTLLKCRQTVASRNGHFASKLAALKASDEASLQGQTGSPMLLKCRLAAAPTNGRSANKLTALDPSVVSAPASMVGTKTLLRYRRIKAPINSYITDKLSPMKIPAPAIPRRYLASQIFSRYSYIVKSGLRRLGSQGQIPRWLPGLVFALITATTLLIPSWQIVKPAQSDSFLAGQGGIPGGREMGLWVRDNVPEGARFMTIGPSMANIIMYYGYRQAYGLSISPNPLHRNPSYEPVYNPDFQLRTGDLQYVVWDSFSAGRSSFFSEKLLWYVNRYHGRVVHTQTVTVEDGNGELIEKPVIIIYEVHP